MFDYIWNKNKQYKMKKIVSEEKYNKIIPTIWSEHCVECSAPSCYDTCTLYEKREDGKCVRIIDTIRPMGINNATGNKQGAYLHFAKWAKIECSYYSKSLSVNQINKIYKIIDFMGCLFANIARVLPIKKRWIITDGVYSARQKLINFIVKKRGQNCKNMYLILRASSIQSTKIFIEIKHLTSIVYRNSVEIDNELKNQYIKIPCFDDLERRFMSIYFQDNDSNHLVEMEYLELVDEPEIIIPKQNSDKKIKCVIWDLDNTIWDGILIEDDKVILKSDIIDIIKDLDNKGIVNSICSKNDYDVAYEKLKEFGIEEFFVFPKINWEPKSINIEKTLKQMNISEDTIVFVDDNPFEREEVRSIIQKITVIDVKDISDFVKNVRCDVTVTEDSKKRRNTYHMIEKQQKELEMWTGNIDEFLRSCNTQLLIGTPMESELNRCYELLQRTNQLNASGRRLSYEQVEEYCYSKGYETYVLICSDKYGSYGQVGFSIVKKDSIPLIEDFVISCRVANKKIEHAFIQYLAEKSETKKIKIVYKQTSKNGPIFKVVQDLGMNLCEKTDSHDIYEYKVNDEMVGIVTVAERKAKMNS